MEECAVAGVPYEIVPAATAALAAGADARVPLTFRKLATSVRILTMNGATIKDERFDWQQFVAPATTYALYMGLSALAGVCERLLAVGVPAERPMAIVDRASMPSMQVVVGTVGTLPSSVEGRSDLEGPAMVLLGDVVSLRDRLAGTARPAVQPQAVDPSYAAALAALPAISDEGLEKLRDKIDGLLSQRRGSSGALEPPAKRQMGDAAAASE